jgi:hypothetical protein
MHHICNPKRMLTGLLAVALAALFVQAAAAHPVNQNDDTFVQAPLVIPYLSHGVGVDRSLYGGTSTSSAKTPLVIPYLSHGVGVDQSLYGGTGQPSDVFSRAVARHEALVKEMNATAATSGRYDLVRGVFVPTLAGAATQSQPTAVRPDDRAGIRGIAASNISSQSQPTAVRPDDRIGLRGIGPFRVTKSASSAPSSTNWSAVLAFGGVVLGMVLILAVGVALSRRQHSRVLAH